MAPCEVTILDTKLSDIHVRIVIGTKKVRHLPCQALRRATVTFVIQFFLSKPVRVHTIAVERSLRQVHPFVYSQICFCCKTALEWMTSIS